MLTLAAVTRKLPQVPYSGAPALATFSDSSLMLRRRLICGLAALPLVLGAGCSDLPTPADPGARIADAAAPARTEAAYELVSGAVVRPMWTSFTPIPDSSWILVEVRGTISYSRNPYCYVVKGYCDAPALPLETGSPYGPLQEGAEARITTRFGSQPPPFLFGEGIPLSSPTGDPRSQIGRRLFHNTSGPGQLWAMHELRQTWAGSATSGVYWPVHEIAGAQVLDVKVVPTPLRVDGPTTVPPGEAGTWNAAVVGDFRLRAGNGVPPVRWEFFPGDTSARHNDFARREVLPLTQCGTLVCTYTPDRGGRMVAWTYVEGENVRVASQAFRLREQDPVLDVQCTPSPLLRGATVTCTARVNPSQQMIVIRREASGPGFQVREQLSSAVAKDSSYDWAGTAVADTRVTIHVRVTHNGVQKVLRGADRFVVTPRTWNPFQITEAPRARREIRGRMTNNLSNGVYGNFSPTGLDPFSTSIDSVGVGPNAGLIYLVDRPPFIGTGASVAVHPALYSPPLGKPWGHPDWQRWYNDQNGRPGGTCTQAEVPRLRSEVERHEGLTLANDSHVGVANRAFIQHRPDRELEALYLFRRPREALFQRAYSRYEAFIRGPQSQLQNQFDTQDYAAIAAKFTCVFDLNPADQ